MVRARRIGCVVDDYRTGCSIRSYIDNCAGRSCTIRGVSSIDGVAACAGDGERSLKCEVYWDVGGTDVIDVDVTGGARAKGLCQRRFRHAEERRGQSRSGDQP